MKRVVLLLFVLLPVMSYSQNKYSVYKSAGNVKTYNTDSMVWASVEKGDVLDGNDVVDVPLKYGLHVLEPGSNRIYANVKVGKHTVRDIIEKSKKDANSTFKNLNRQIVKNVAKSGQGKGYYTYGMTTRGLGDDLNFVDSLYFSIYECIRNFQSVDDLSLCKVTKEDGTISFVIENNSETVLYVSVVYGNSSHISLCLEDEFMELGAFPLQPNTSLDLTSFKFIEPLEGENYYVIASELGFNLAPIKTRLRYMREPDYSADADLVMIAVAE